MNNFIQRPVLAIVISLIILFLGILAVFRLPMSQFPAIAPPEVNVTVEYAGANAETVTRAAIVPLERAINGVPGMKYMSSDAGNDGVGVIQVIHEVGTDPDIAAVNIQNRVAAVMGELPEEVIKNGVKIAKEENAMLMYLNIFSSDTTLTEKFLYNFADINILTELKRVKGVGYADILGAKEYAMRIWLKPDRMLSYGVGVDDIMEALQAQNIEAAPGKIGENSEKTNFPIQYVIKYPGKYSTEAAYADIPIKSVSDGRMLTIKDVADVEFGTTYFDVEARFNGMPAASIMLKQLPGSNAAEVIGQVKQKMAELKEKTFPQGMDYEVSYDVSKFMEASIRDLLKTVVEAFALVSLVVFVFLQSWRATLIPILAVPISLVGTFFFMQLFGFSVNLITLFALVLAIGIVVDDAIVVVEAVHAELERNRELSPLIATQLAMKKVTRPIIAITLVMSAVFVPAAFLPGPTGIFYRQFSLTVATSIVLSGIVALTLTPALCPLILKRPPTRPASGKLLPRFFGWFNRGYGQMEDKYRLLLLKIVDRRVVTFAVLVLFLLASGTLSRAVPSGFIPDEDQGTFYVSVTSPPGATLERTKETVNEIRSIALELPAVSSVSTLAGTNILSDGTGATYGTCLINLKDWDERHESVSAVMAMLEQKARHIKSAQLEFFPPPAVPGYGNASGFEMRLLDKTGSDDLKQMETVVNDFLSHLKARKEIGSAFTIFDASYPEYMVHVDEHLAAQKGVSVSDIMASLQTLFGSEYATNFIRFGQMSKVMVQA
ncbi:MAG: efflux RND transporter permease subunit, partial [Solitalea sp.]